MVQCNLRSIPFFVIIIVVFLFGRTGYQANFIPFGLDQLLEAPSSSLALFIHWVIWADSIGKLIIQILFAVYICEVKSHIASTTANGRVANWLWITDFDSTELFCYFIFEVL